MKPAKSLESLDLSSHFPHFSNLPAEIRRLIWEHAAADMLFSNISRFLRRPTITTSAYQTLLALSFSPSGLEFFGIFGACHLARARAFDMLRKQYEGIREVRYHKWSQVPTMVLQKGHVWVDWERRDERGNWELRMCLLVDFRRGWKS